MSQALFDAGVPHTQWGKFADAVSRWASVLGRDAPAPTTTGRHGKPVLRPEFVEWLMGQPPGLVTAVPGLTRIQQLHVLGNGVVRQQAAAALVELLAPAETERPTP